MFNPISPASPVATLLLCILRNVLSDIAVSGRNLLQNRPPCQIMSPHRQRRSSELPEYPAAMYRISKAGGLSHLVERGACISGKERLRSGF